MLLRVVRQTIFGDALVSETAYDMQLRSRLRNMHRIAGQAIEKLYPNDKDHFSDLAYHYQKAEIRNKSLAYLEKAADYAADYAKDNYLNQMALDLYEQLLDQLSENEIEKRIDTLLKKGEVLSLIGEWAECENVNRKVLNLAKKNGDKNRIASAYQALGLLLTNNGDYDQAMDYIKVTLKINEEIGNKQGIAIDAGNMGDVYSNKGDYDTALVV